MKQALSLYRFNVFLQHRTTPLFFKNTNRIFCRTFTENTLLDNQIVKHSPIPNEVEQNILAQTNVQKKIQIFHHVQSTETPENLKQYFELIIESFTEENEEDTILLLDFIHQGEKMLHLKFSSKLLKLLSGKIINQHSSENVNNLVNIFKKIITWNTNVNMIKLNILTKIFENNEFKILEELFLLLIQEINEPAKQANNKFSRLEFQSILTKLHEKNEMNLLDKLVGYLEEKTSNQLVDILIYEKLLHHYLISKNYSAYEKKINYLQNQLKVGKLFTNSILNDHFYYLFNNKINNSLFDQNQAREELFLFYLQYNLIEKLNSFEMNGIMYNLLTTNNEHAKMVILYQKLKEFQQEKFFTSNNLSPSFELIQKEENNDKQIFSTQKFSYLSFFHSLHKLNSIEKIESLFSEIKQKYKMEITEIQLNLLIQVNSKYHNDELVFYLFNKMRELNIQPLLITYQNIFTTFVRNQKFTSTNLEEKWKKILYFWNEIKRENIKITLECYRVFVNSLLLIVDDQTSNKFTQSQLSEVLQWLIENKILVGTPITQNHVNSQTPNRQNSPNNFDENFFNEDKIEKIIAALFRVCHIIHFGKFEFINIILNKLQENDIALHVNHLVFIIDHYFSYNSTEQVSDKPQKSIQIDDSQQFENDSKIILNIIENKLKEEDLKLTQKIELNKMKLKLLLHSTSNLDKLKEVLNELKSDINDNKNIAGIAHHAIHKIILNYLQIKLRPHIRKNQTKELGKNKKFSKEFYSELSEINTLLKSELPNLTNNDQRNFLSFLQNEMNFFYLLTISQTSGNTEKKTLDDDAKFIQSILTFSNEEMKSVLANEHGSKKEVNKIESLMEIYYSHFQFSRILYIYENFIKNKFLNANLDNENSSDLSKWNLSITIANQLAKSFIQLKNSFLLEEFLSFLNKINQKAIISVENMKNIFLFYFHETSQLNQKGNEGNLANTPRKLENLFNYFVKLNFEEISEQKEQLDCYLIYLNTLFILNQTEKIDSELNKILKEFQLLPHLSKEFIDFIFSFYFQTNQNSKFLEFLSSLNNMTLPAGKSKEITTEETIPEVQESKQERIDNTARALPLGTVYRTLVKFFIREKDEKKVEFYLEEFKSRIKHKFDSQLKREVLKGGKSKAKQQKMVETQKEKIQQMYELIIEQYSKLPDQINLMEKYFEKMQHEENSLSIPQETVIVLLQGYGNEMRMKIQEGNFNTHKPEYFKKLKKVENEIWKSAKNEKIQFEYFLELFTQLKEFDCLFKASGFISHLPKYPHLFNKSIWIPHFFISTLSSSYSPTNLKVLDIIFGEILSNQLIPSDLENLYKVQISDSTTSDSLKLYEECFFFALKAHADAGNIEKLENYYSLFAKKFHFKPISIKYFDLYLKYHFNIFHSPSVLSISKIIERIIHSKAQPTLTTHSSVLSYLLSHSLYRSFLFYFHCLLPSASRDDELVNRLTTLESTANNHEFEIDRNLLEQLSKLGPPIIHIKLFNIVLRGLSLNLDYSAAEIEHYFNSIYKYKLLPNPKTKNHLFAAYSQRNSLDKLAQTQTNSLPYDNSSE